MASAWGAAWSNFWGNSWGSVEAGGEGCTPSFQADAFEFESFQVCPGETPAPTPEGTDVGGRIVGGHFSRGQWRDFRRKKDEEWRLAVEAQERAEERALELTQKKQQKAYEAAKLADRAITMAAAAERIELAKLTIALNAAVSAEKVSAFMRGMAQVDTISRSIIRRIEEEQDEEDAITLLLSSL